MTPKSTRERVLLVVLPALLIVLLYGAKLHGILDRRTAAAAAAEQAAAKAPPMQVFAATRKQMDELNAQVREVQTAQQKIDAQWESLRASRRPDSNRRVQAIAHVTAVLADCSLNVRDAGPEDKQQDVKLPMVLERVRKQLAGSPTPGTATNAAANVPLPDAPLFRVRFEGRYVDVVRALDRLAKDEPLIVPLRLSMADAPLEGAERSWTLWLWM
jgi:hypothetical protein